MPTNASGPANPITGATIGALTAASEKRSEAARRQHQRDVRRRVLLPIAVGAVVSMLFLIALAVLFSGRQIGIIASFSAVIVIVPIVIVCLIPYALLIVGVAGMGRVYKVTEKVLIRGQKVSRTVHLGTVRISKTATRPFISAQKRLAWLERISRVNRSRQAGETTRNGRR